MSDEYKEREAARQAVLMRCDFVGGAPASFPVPMRLSRCKDGGEPNAWASAKGDIYRSAEQAAFADHMETEEYKSYWRRRSAANHLVKATAIDAQQYDGPVVDGDDNYYATVDDFLERHDSENPSWIAACKTEEFNFDLEGHLNSYVSENHHEDAELEFTTELSVFFADWCRRQSLVSWHEDRKTVVVLDRSEFERELVHAKLVLEETVPMASPYGVKP